VLLGEKLGKKKQSIGNDNEVGIIRDQVVLFLTKISFFF
jgi:hypothetical protein